MDTSTFRLVFQMLWFIVRSSLLFILTLVIFIEVLLGTQVLIAELLNHYTYQIRLLFMFFRVFNNPAK